MIREKAKRKINATPKNESPPPYADVTKNDDETFEVRHDKLRSEYDAFRKELFKLTSTVHKQAGRTGIAMSRQRELVIVRIGNEFNRDPARLVHLRI